MLTSLAIGIALAIGKRRCPAPLLWFAVLLMVPAWAAGVGEQPPPAAKKTLPSKALLESFDMLSPGQRWQRLEKAANVAKECEAAVRGDLVQTVVARGSLESANSENVVCTVRAPKETANAAVIKWIIAEGKQVKKGDLLIQLDETPLLGQLKNQKAVLDAARADLAKAKDDFDMVGLDNEATTLSCDIDLRTAELVQKKYRGDDVDEAAILKLQVDRAKLNMTRAKALARSRLATAQAVIATKKALVEDEESRVRDAEQQIQACRRVAPQDGIVVYFIPERGPHGDARNGLARGAVVREGQKLMQVADLTQMAVNVRVPEAFVTELRDEDPKAKNTWQPARIRVDAYPNRIFKGHVKTVDTIAELHHGLDGSDGILYYPALVSIDENPDGLKPWMSAEVTIDTGRAVGVLHVLLQAVVRAGPKSYCYVKRGKEIHKTPVTPGLRGDARVEIKAGLKEGDEVLRDPLGVLGQLQAVEPPASPERKQSGTGARPLQVCGATNRR